MLRVLPLAALLMMVVACAGNDNTTTIQRTVSVPAEVSSTVSCTNGTAIVVAGDVALGGLGARLAFRNNVKGTHENTQDLAASVVLVDDDVALEIPTQTANGQPVADPWISVVFVDQDGNEVGSEIVIGSCDEGTLAVNATAVIEATVTLDVSVAGCHNSPGPTITLDGDVRFSGLSARIIVRNGENGPIAGEVTGSADIVALADGETLSIPKQPVQGGVGGNPWIYAQLTSGDDDLTEEILIGRCVQLAGGDDEADDDSDEGDEPAED